MPAAYLHGVETIVLNKGPRPVNIVKTAVIGLVGTAPTGPVNTLTLVNSQKDAEQFGAEVPGFTIPQALSAIFAQGVASVLVVNVFNSAVDASLTTAVTSEPHTPAAGKLSLSYAPVGGGSAVVITNNDDSASTLVYNEDYSIDDYGNFVALSANVVNGTALKFTYYKLSTSAITATVIKGSYTSSTGVRTGMQQWDLAKNLYGFNAKILIAPGYSSLTAVSAELIVKADKFRAICLLDAAYSTTVAAAITNRGTASTANFKTASKRAVLLYPYLKAYNAATNADQDRPYSQFMAGVIAATDYNFGYWYSPSNKEIKGITGAERVISSGDVSSDANALNEAGITTIYNTFGQGLNTWGNRSAAYPTITTVDNFIAVQRVADVVDESLENASLQFVDQPITNATIDAIRETGNGFIRQLIQRGALIVGSEVQFDGAKNTTVDIAAGHLTFDVVICPPVPAERISYERFIDINLFKNLL